MSCSSPSTTSYTVPAVTTIQATECIGNSLNTINANYQSLKNGITTTQNYVSDQLTYLSCLVSNVGSFKNKLINSQGIINQRNYTSGTATTAPNQYTLDRWRVVTTGQNLTFSTANNITTFNAPVGGVEQVIEGLNIETETYVLSWIGTAAATVNGTPVANGETVTLTGGSNVTVRFTGGTFSLPQLEKGTTVTAFEHRPVNVELPLCQRYYETTYPSGRSPGSIFNPSVPQAYDGLYTMRFSSSGNSAGLYWFYKYVVTKRTKPTITAYSTYTGAAGTCSVFSAALTYYTQYLVNYGDGATGTGYFTNEHNLFANVPSPGIPVGYYAQAHFTIDAEL